MVQGSLHPIPVGQSDDDEELLAFISQGSKLSSKERSRLVTQGRKLLPSIYDATRSPEGRGHFVQAKCRGSMAGKHYDQCLKLTAKLTVSHLSCTCPYFTKSEAGICKHSIALVVWTCKDLEEADTAAAANEGDVDKGDEELLEREDSKVPEETSSPQPEDGSMDGFFDDWLGPSKATQQATQKQTQKQTQKDPDGPPPPTTTTTTSKKRPDPSSSYSFDDGGDNNLKRSSSSGMGEDGWRARDLGNRKVVAEEPSDKKKGKKQKVSFKAKFIRLGFKLDF